MKVNELAERHGLSPCDIVVTTSVTDTGDTRLFFEKPPIDTTSQGRYMKMLGSLGLSAAEGGIIGHDAKIYAQLQDAVDRAPRPQRRL